MPEPAPPPDQTARDRVRTDLDTTLFVQAGAGSGKTTALVERVLALVTEPSEPSGPDAEPVPLSAVAAITFTEKAGAELRERLRQRLEEAIDDAAATEVGRDRAERCRAALDDLDGAAIGTLHSFAQRILSEHPVEAGLPPRVDVLDEVTSGVRFERRWNRFSDRLFADAAYERTLLLLYAAGTRDSTPHALARTFDANWDLVATHVRADEPPPGPVLDRALAVLDRVEEVCARRAECADPADLLATRLVEVAEWATRVRGAVDEHALIEELRRAREPRGVSFKSRGGRAALWRVPVGDVKADLAEAGEAIDALLAEVATECARHLGSAIRGFTLASADERRREGTLEFHDLLVLARSLLRDPEHGAEVRRALHHRYRRLLLDEFQDTDPIQIELAVRIAAAEPGTDAAGAAPWVEVEVAPGRLFVVGDPKQSIYRFRRADIALFLQASERFGDAAGTGLALSANFRTVPSVIGWVNGTFAALMAEDPARALPLASRPPYVALDPVRSDPPPDGGPPVAVVGRAAHPPGTRAPDLRRAEADDVAATARQVIAEAWLVGDGRAPDGSPRWRPARLGDITILVPARTSLPYLEDALSEAGMAYRAEASSLVYASRAVRDLLMVVRAVADPTDELAVVSALRTPLFGCGDDDLYRHRVEREGSWSPLAAPPDDAPDDDPVVAGLAALGRWHRLRTSRSPSALLETIVHERRAFELAFAEGRPRDVWRRLRFVVDQARAWTDATGGDLRGYLDWVLQQTVEGARVAEAVLPETDDDAVRIMTIHAAKGLEFPVTIVSGLSSTPGHGPRAGDARFITTSDSRQGDVAYYLGKHAETTEFTATRPLDEQMGFDERIRLLYVATTRAQDHLVVSLHRAERRSAPSSPANRTNAELLVEGMGADVLDAVPDAVDPDAVAALAPLAAAPVAAPPPYAAWAAEHDAALRRASRRSTVAATALGEEAQPLADDLVSDDGDPGSHDEAVVPAEPPADDGGQLVIDFAAVAVDTDLDHAPDGGDAGLRKRPGDQDRPPWLKGRYGTAVGRAVHGVLQTVPLGADPDGPEVAAAVAAQAQAEAVVGREAVVRQLVADALRSPSVRAAAGAPHWREIYLSAPIGERVLEGYVDLLYRTDDGLVVVDYKTAATSDPAELDRRVEGYRFQGASYALLVGRATGDDVARVTFSFLTPQGVVERHLDDLPASMVAVEAAVRTGTEVEVDRRPAAPPP